MLEEGRLEGPFLNSRSIYSLADSCALPSFRDQSNAQNLEPPRAFTPVKNTTRWSHLRAKALRDKSSLGDTKDDIKEIKEPRKRNHPSTLQGWVVYFIFIRLFVLFLPVIWL